MRSVESDKVTAAPAKMATVAGTASLFLKGKMPHRKTARNSQMQYYVSLPPAWTPAKKWPILVAIDGANGGSFLFNALNFAVARGSRPYIIVAPVVLTNTGTPNPKNYSYPQTVWDKVALAGASKFDEDGLLDVVRSVQRDYGGEDKFFITGWSAGGHLTWQMIFTHPDRLLAAAPVCSNYIGRGVTTVSNAPERIDLPVRAFQGEQDRLFGVLNQQWESAKALCDANNYKNVTRQVVHRAGHSACAQSVLNYFDEILHQ